MKRLRWEWWIAAVLFVAFVFVCDIGSHFERHLDFLLSLAVFEL